MILHTEFVLAVIEIPYGKAPLVPYPFSSMEKYDVHSGMADYKYCLPHFTGRLQSCLHSFAVLQG